MHRCNALCHTGDPWPKKATALLECNCWGLATEADRAAVQAGLLVDASLPRPEKVDLCRQLGLEVQDEVWGGEGSGPGH